MKMSLKELRQASENETVELKVMEVGDGTKFAQHPIYGFLEKGTIKLRGKIEARGDFID